MTARTYKALSDHHQMLMRSLQEDIRRSAYSLYTHPTVRDKIETGLVTVMEITLKEIALKEGIDFAILFTVDGQLRASFPRELNDLDVEKTFASWGLGKRMQELLKDDTNIDIIVDTFSQHDPAELRILGIEDKSTSNAGGISIASAGIMKNDFGEPMGIYLVGKLLTNAHDSLRWLYDMTGSSSVIYFEFIPIAQAGFDNPDDPVFDFSVLQVIPGMLAKVYETVGNQDIVLTLAGDTYLTTCSPLESLDNKKIGVMCVGTPQSQIAEAHQAVMLYGHEAKKSVQAWILGIGVISLGLFAIMSLLIATNIVRPLKQLSRFAKSLAKRDFQQEITISSHDEIGELSDSLREVVKSFREITTTSAAISRGDLSHEITPRSKQDVLGYALQGMFTFLNKMATVATAIAEGDLRQEIQPKSEQDILGKAFQNMVMYFREMANVAGKIAMGDLRQDIQPKTEHDVLGNAFQQMMTYVQKVADVAERISNGDLRINVTPESQQDVLNHSLKEMIQYIQDVANVAERISNYDLYVEVTAKSGQDILNVSLQRMVTNLQMAQRNAEESMVEIEQQNWFKTGQAELSDAMHGEHDVTTLAQNTITYLANYLQAQVGTIYLADEEQILRLVGSYAYVTRKGNRNEFKFGQGLVGQAALEKQSILFTDVPDNYIPIMSGLGEAVPRNILVVPFMYEGVIEGVIELGTVHQFTEMQRHFIEQACESIAITFHSGQSRVKMEELLNETRRQAEVLQTQQEELRQTNEELQEQTEALKVSEHKLQAQQEELRQTNEELEEQARILEQQKQKLEGKNTELDRARQLVEEKAKDLELSSKYKSEFLANMSHELRTPLNSLLILSQFLIENKDGNLTTRQTDCINTIYTAGVDLLELINEVLDLAKVEAGKVVMNIEEMSLRGLVNYIEQNFSHVIEQKGLYLKVELADGLPESIRTDRQRVEQITKNFLSNAIKFTEIGGVSVYIKRPVASIDLSLSGLDPQHVIAISVSDTGIGIPEDKQRLIFEAFQQADGTTSRKYGGTGLGLSISRELIKLLGGKIHLHSKEGEGSTFTLYLPEMSWQEGESKEEETRGEEQKTKQEEQTKDKIHITEQQFPSAPSLPDLSFSSGIDAIRDDRREVLSSTDKFLLIIENDPKFVKILFDLAREKGFKALVAGDGAAGLQLAYQYKPKAIILDVGLFGVSDWTVLEKLKANPETRHIPVHFISVQETPLDTMKMEVIDYLTKPVEFDKVNDAFIAIEEGLAKPLKKVLVIEDDDTMRASMLELLGGEGVVIMTAETGQEAYNLLQVELFDCLVLDLGLADISGFDLLEKIKIDATMLHLPIIVYTGKELSKEEEVYLKQYAESIIIKGVKSPERLLDEVTLFLHRVDANLPETQQRKLQMLHEKEEVLEGRTILMVDDDIRNVFALSNVLEERGMQVLVAEHGKEALELLDTHSKIDLVLMDIMMPEMDGYEAMRKIREQRRFIKLPIIALTAKAMKGDRQKCLDAGANDYLSKPVETDRLLSLLQVWLY